MSILVPAGTRIPQILFPSIMAQTISQPAVASLRFVNTILFSEYNIMVTRQRHQVHIIPFAQAEYHSHERSTSYSKRKIPPEILHIS